MSDEKAGKSQQNEALSISCLHGSRPSAVVCRHLVRDRARGLGFVENNDDPNDLQAWCDDCERVFLDEGGQMTERFLQFNDFALVCDICYANIKAQNIAN